MKLFIKNRNLFVPILFLFSILLFVNCSGCNKSEPEDIVPIVEKPGNEWIIYEVYPGLFKEGNTFNEISARLDILKELNVNVIWLMPIYEQGQLNAIGSPYCVKDYKKLNNTYGTLSEFKSLVSKAHSMGMKVIIDWIANHTSWDNSWIQQKEWYTQDSGGNIISPAGMNWNDVADLNYNNSQMREAMISAMKHWISETGIDGYRCDYAEGVPGDFWSDAIQQLKDLKGDDLLMLAEGGKITLFDYGFDMIYAWDFAYKLQDLYSGKTDVKSLFETHQKEFTGIPEGKQRMRYSTNHDMSSDKSPIEAFKCEEGALSAFVIATTLGGSPMIYSSQEIAYPTSLSFFQFHQIDWNSNASYFNQYKQIMDIYASSEALKKGSLLNYETGRVATYLRKSNNEKVLIMVNTTGEVQVAKSPIEFASESGTNLITKTTETISPSITLQPFQFKIWRL